MISIIYRTEEPKGLNTEEPYNFNKKSTAIRKNLISKHIGDTILQKSGDICRGICQCTNPKCKKVSYNNILLEGNYYFYGSGDIPSSYGVIYRRCLDSCYPTIQPDWEELEKTLTLFPTLPGSYEGLSDLFDLCNPGLLVNLNIISISTNIM